MKYKTHYKTQEYIPAPRYEYNGRKKWMGWIERAIREGKFYLIPDWLEEHKQCTDIELGIAFGVSRMRIGQARQMWGILSRPERIKKEWEEKSSIINKQDFIGFVRRFYLPYKHIFEISQKFGLTEQETNILLTEMKLRGSQLEMVGDDLLMKIIQMGSSAWRILYLLGFPKEKRKSGYYSVEKGKHALGKRLEKLGIKIKRKGNAEALQRWRMNHPQEFREVRKGPSNPEMFLDKMTPSNIQYVGCGGFFVRFLNGRWKSPDFIIEDKPRCIEIHGDYWHKGENVQKLIALYAEVGWDCLVIWHNYLMDFPEDTLRTVYDFANDIWKLGKQREIGRNFFEGQFYFRGKMRER